jgi:8-oxo-dGTP diphosphatase
MMAEQPTVRVAAGVVVRDQDRVLLIRRRGEGTWGLPGGGVEPGETWSGAAIRECLEETGWHIRIDELLGIYSDPATQIHRYPGGSLRHFVGVVFLATPLEEVTEPGDEAAEVEWFHPDHLPSPLFAPDVPVLKDARNPARRSPIID